MKKNLTGIRHAALLLFVFVFAQGAASGSGKTYEEQLAEARRLADEKSWALARDAYAEATKAAPDDDAKRWCGLWQAQAEWQAVDSNNRWSVSSDINKKIGTLLSPYQGGPNQQARPRDQFWAEATDFHAKTKGGNFVGDDSWAMWREVFDYWLEQPPSAEAGGRLMRFLRGLEYAQIEARYSNARGFAETLTSVSKNASLPADDRAWCALHAAWILTMRGQSSRQSRESELWQEAVILCRGTPYEPIAEACLLNAQALTNEPGAVFERMTVNRELWCGGFGAVLARARELDAQLKTAPRLGMARNAAEVLAKLIHTWKEPILHIFANGEMRPGEALEFTVCATFCGALSAELYEFSAEGYEKWGEFKNRSPAHLAGMRGYENFLRTSEARLVQSMTLLENARAEDYLFHSGVFQFSPPGKGFYLLAVRDKEVSGNERATMSLVVVSEAKAFALAPSQGDMQMHILKRADDEPFANAPVSLAWLARKDTDKREHWSGTSDANGSVLVPMPESGEFVGFADGQPLLVGVSRPYRRHEEKFPVDLFLDRPLYRPGETVRWKLMARERKEGCFEICAGEAVFSVEMDGEALVNKLPVKLNSFGTAHGEFFIPAGARPGQATCEVSVDNMQKQMPGAFLVDNFLPAAMRTTVELPGGTESVRPGSEVAVRIKAEYFSGGPAVGVPADCKFFVQPGWSDDIHRNSAAPKKYGDWIKELGGREPQRALTDANGEAVFRLKLHEDLPDGSLLLVIGAARPEGMPGAATRQNYTINRAGYSVDYPMLQYPSLVEPGTECVFVLNVSDAAGKACAFEGEAFFYERRWVEVWLDPEGRRVSGVGLENARMVVRKPATAWDEDDDAATVESFVPGEDWDSKTAKQWEYTMPAGWTKLFADFATVPVGEAVPVSCGGDGRLEVRFTPPGEGIYELRLEKDGRELKPVHEWEWWRGYQGWDWDWDWERARTESSWFNEDRRMIFVAANESTTTLAFKPEDAFVLGLERHRAGEPLRCVLVLPEGCRDAFLSIMGEQSAISQRVTQHNRVGVVTLMDVPKMAGMLSGSLFGIKQRGGGRVTLRVQDERRQIALEVVPDRAGACPGDTGMITVNARDFSGEPLRAEVVVSITDNAVNEMAEVYGMRLHEPRFLKHARVSREQWRVAGITQKITANDDRRQGAALIALCGGPGGTSILSKYVVSADREGAAMASQNISGSRAAMSFGRHWNAGEMAKAREETPHGMPGIRLRRHFASTAFWEPELVTDAGGRAQVNFTYPDNLTQWRIAAYAVGEDGNTFGVAQTLTRTSLPLQARVLAPRFLVEGDTAALAGLLVNRTDADLKVAANMTGEGAIDLAAAVREVFTPGHGEARASWQTKAREPGAAMVTLVAKAAGAPDAADAMQTTLPVLEDGIRQDTAACARLAAGDAGAEMLLMLPDPLNRERLDAEIVIAQGRASVMLDALPYLIDYPYGCVEQTMSRFLPAVVVKKTLTGFGFDANAVEKRIMAKEPRVAQIRRVRSAGLGKLDDVVSQCLSRMREADRYSYGFGWWPGYDSGELWMTAYAAWGLQMADEAGVAVGENWIHNVRRALFQMMQRHATIDDRLAWALFVMSEAPAAAQGNENITALQGIFARVYAEREKLSAAGRACLLAASARWGTDAERVVLLRNLENGAQRTARDAHWGATNGFWRATEGAVESTALSVMALLKVAPGHALVEPALDWLAMNRRGTGWRNTRASAFAVLALARSVAGTGEGVFEGNVDVFLNGKKLRDVGLSRESLLAGAVRVALPAELLRSGDNRIELRHIGSAGKGSGLLYASALASTWARSDSVRDEGNLVSVARGFSGRRIEPTLGGGGKLRATALAETGVARAGDEVTARVVLTVPGELEYLMMAVPKPAGCEPLNPLSGWDAELVRVDAPEGARSSGRHRIYREEHDDHSAFFLDHVEAGEWEIRFTMRAVTPGDFRALPVKVEAMYAPEVRANSDARRVRIE